MKYFLLVYDRTATKLLDLTAYEEHELDRATKERYMREIREQNPDIEVVLFGAESLDALKRTHARYFRTLKELTADFGLAPA